MGNSEATNANWSSTARFQIGTRSQTCRGKGPERASRRARAREECLSGPTSALRAGRVLTTSEIHCDASGGCAFRPPPRMGKRSQSLGCATPSIPQWTPQASAQIPAGLRAPLEPAHHAARAAPTSCFAEFPTRTGEVCRRGAGDHGVALDRLARIGVNPGRDVLARVSLVSHRVAIETRAHWRRRRQCAHLLRAKQKGARSWPRASDAKTAPRFDPRALPTPTAVYVPSPNRGVGMVHSLSPADLQMPAHTNADNLGLFGRWRTGANLVLAEGVAAANPLWLSAHIWKISVGSGFLASCPLYASTTLH